MMIDRRGLFTALGTAGAVAAYAGTVTRSQRTFGGWCLAQAARMIGAPLPLHDHLGAEAPAIAASAAAAPGVVATELGRHPSRIRVAVAGSASWWWWLLGLVVVLEAAAAGGGVVRCPRGPRPSSPAAVPLTPAPPPRSREAKRSSRDREEAAAAVGGAAAAAAAEKE